MRAYTVEGVDTLKNVAAVVDGSDVVAVKIEASVLRRWLVASAVEHFVGTEHSVMSPLMIPG